MWKKPRSRRIRGGSFNGFKRLQIFSLLDAAAVVVLVVVAGGSDRDVGRGGH